MLKPLLLGGILILLMAFALACGEAATPEPTAAPPTSAPTAAPTAAPTEAPTPTEAAMEEATEAPAMTGSDVEPALLAAAEARAGGPGAFYLGDGDYSRLVGPAPAEG